MIKKDTRFLIVGLGLIGGSYAMGLKRNGFHVDAIDINQLSIDYAKEHDIIDEGSTFAQARGDCPQGPEPQHV